MHGVAPVVIRASVLGRLLGIRLLRLEADISLFPADLGSSSTVGPSPRIVTSSATTDGTGGLTDAVELLAHASRTLDETPPSSRPESARTLAPLGLSSRPVAGGPDPKVTGCPNLEVDGVSSK
jgi:hypothetical protein